MELTRGPLVCEENCKLLHLSGNIKGSDLFGYESLNT